MRFIVKRTSQYQFLDEKSSPCDESIRLNYYKTEKYFDFEFESWGKTEEERNKSWLGTGKNHRVENEYIKREVEESAWFIDITTFDKLIKFIDKYGDCIISKREEDNEFPTIEIYDDYRE